MGDINVIGPRTYYDDLEHFHAFGSSIDQTSDLYGNDTIQVNSYGRATTVKIHGGNDIVYGDTGADTIYDNRGANARPITEPNGTMHILPGSGPSGNDTVYAGGGNDTIFAGDGQNTYDGGSETDTVDYSRASVGVTVDLDTGNGQGRGVGDGTDTLVSIENVTGSNQGDTIAGSDVANVLIGGRGNDRLLGGGKNDTLLGGDDDDTLDGGKDADTMDGGDGVDTLQYLFSPKGVTIDLAKGTAKGGDADGDTFKNIENVWGSQYDDTLIGDNRDNVLLGSKGLDTLVGGGGKDRFVYTSPNESTVARPDVIKDFVQGEDIIDLSGLDNVISPFANGPQPLPSMTFVDGFSGVAGQVTSSIQGGVTMVYADLDGNRVADFAIQLSNSVHLTANDFWL